MTTEVKTEKKKAEENGDDKVDPSLYSCEVVETAYPDIIWGGRS